MKWLQRVLVIAILASVAGCGGTAKEIEPTTETKAVTKDEQKDYMQERLDRMKQSGNVDKRMEATMKKQMQNMK